MARLNRSIRGVALTELALVLPLLLLLTFGVLEYGWLFTKAAELGNAARHGARVGVRPGANSAQVKADIASFMQLAGLNSAQYQVLLTPSEVAGLAPGQTFTVRITVPYSQVELIGFPLVPTPANLRAQVVMAKEGPPGD